MCIHRGEIADRVPVAGHGGRCPPVLADPGQGIAVERVPCQQRVANTGPHDAGEYPLEDVRPGQPARREQLVGQQPGQVVVELVALQPVAHLDPVAAFGKAEMAGADDGTPVRGTAARGCGAEHADEMVVIAAWWARRERVNDLRQGPDRARLAHRPVASADISWAACCSPVRSPTTWTRSQNSA